MPNYKILATFDYDTTKYIGKNYIIFKDDGLFYFDNDCVLSITRNNKLVVYKLA